MKYILTIGMLISVMVLHAQNECSNVKKAKILTNSYQCNWSFFEITDTIEATVILHEKAFVPCAFKATASVTILKTKTDTIRVLDVCNLEDFKVGSKVKVSAISIPRYKVSIPTYFYKDHSKNTYIYRCNEYDEKIHKTTWGHIILPSQTPKQSNQKLKTDVVKSYRD